MVDEVGTRQEGSSKQNIPPGELIPKEEASEITRGLGKELIEALVTIPEFREKAARAFAYGSDRAVFSHKGRDYQVSKGVGLDLRIGEPGAFEFGGTKSRIRRSISMTEIYIYDGSLGAPDIRYQDKGVYRSIPAAPGRPELRVPQENTRVAEAGIRRVIQSLKSS